MARIARAGLANGQRSVALPDCHSGYGFAIGAARAATVAAARSAG